MSLSRRDCIFIGLIAVIILIGTASIVGLQYQVQDTKSRLSALPRGFTVDVHNSFRQSNNLILQVEIHLQTGRLPLREAILDDLRRLQKRLQLMAITLHNSGLPENDRQLIIAESNIYFAELDRLRALLSEPGPMVLGQAEKIRELLARLDDQATFLFTEADDAVYRLGLEQGNLLTQMSVVLTAMIVVLCGLGLIVVVVLRHVFSQRDSLDGLVRLDALTGLGNRRAFDVQIQADLARARRHQQAVALLIVDVDHFKKYNDLYGHVKGDEALQAVASVLQSKMQRVDDGSYRLGGEEFACLFAARDVSGARKQAEDIRHCLEQLEIEHLGNENFGVLTLSGGLFYVETAGLLTSEDVYRAADAALYKAKEGGRNRICLHLVDSNGYVTTNPVKQGAALTTGRVI